jgi:nucleoside-diphosphate-sugar epimerase
VTGFDYANSRATAERLLARFGQVGAIERVTPGGGPAHNPGPSTTTSYPATLVALDYSDRERDGTLIQTGDRKVLISTAGLSITPTSADRIVIQGSRFEIVNLNPLDPAGTVVMWQVQVRQ